MAINANLGQGTVSLAANADATLVNFSGLGEINRYAVAAIDLYNSGASTATVSLYFSDDGTSASGVIVQRVVLPVNQGYSAPTLIGQGSTRNLIARSDQSGVNITTTVTTFD